MDQVTRSLAAPTGRLPRTHLLSNRKSIYDDLHSLPSRLLQDTGNIGM